VVAVTRDEVLDLCSLLPGAVEDYPFGDDVAVFKVGGKMFSLVLLTGDPGSVNLKCDPAWALELRARHEAVRPGYHANKRHWNTVELDGSVDDVDLREMIEHSYELVLRSLPRGQRTGLPGPGDLQRHSGDTSEPPGSAAGGAL
jgi:predicted DNA-binding protein (MmcQ/YjbR family)